MNDTAPNIAAIVRERLLSRPGAERVVMGSRMFDVARTIALASFPPGLSEIETKRRLCERLYGNEINVEAYINTSSNRKLNEPSAVYQSLCAFRLLLTATL